MDLKTDFRQTPPLIFILRQVPDCNWQGCCLYGLMDIDIFAKLSRLIFFLQIFLKTLPLMYVICQVPDCNGHGHCEDGSCICMKGYKGEFCQEGENKLIIKYLTNNYVSRSKIFANSCPNPDPT